MPRSVHSQDGRDPEEHLFLSLALFLCRARANFRRQEGENEGRRSTSKSIVDDVVVSDG